MKVKLLLSFFVVVCGFFVTGQAFAQNQVSSSSATYQTPVTDSNVPQNLTTYSQSVVLELSAAVSCQLFGVDPMRPNSKCLGVNPQTGKIGFVENGGGVIAVMSQMIGSLYNIPINTSDYTKYLASSFLPTKQTQAQVFEGGSGTGGGTTTIGKNCQNSNDCQTGQFCDDSQVSLGAERTCQAIPNYGEKSQQIAEAKMANAGSKGLRPFASLWIIFRNVTYILFVVIFVVLGLGIMLRLPVDQRAVMSIQNQIPKLIISLLLVTFSLAIAGFLIDIMYLLIFLFFSLLNNASGTAGIDVSSMNPANLQGGNPFSAMTLGGGSGVGAITKDTSVAVGGIIATLFDGSIGSTVAGFVGGLLQGVAGSLVPVAGPAVVSGVGNALNVGGAIDSFGSSALGFIGTMIAFFVIGIALLSALFRIWFKLLQAYVLFMFDVILGPFWIVGGIIPGVKFGFGQWFRSLVGNLSVFPTVVVMFLLGKAIVDVVRSGARGFVPPLIGDSLAPEHLASIIGLGVILATPSIMDNVKKSFGTTGVPTQSIGQALGVGQAVGGALLGGARSALWNTNRAGQRTGILNAFLIPRVLGENRAEAVGRRGGLAGGLQQLSERFGRNRAAPNPDQGGDFVPPGQQGGGNPPPQPPGGNQP